MMILDSGLLFGPPCILIGYTSIAHENSIGAASAVAHSYWINVQYLLCWTFYRHGGSRTPNCSMNRTSRQRLCQCWKFTDNVSTSND